MRSPPLLFFSIAIVGALFGLSFRVDPIAGASLFGALAVGAWLCRVRAARALLACFALAIFVATSASYQRSRFDEVLEGLSAAPAQYEGTLLELSDNLRAEKVGLIEVTASSRAVDTQKLEGNDEPKTVLNSREQCCKSAFVAALKVVDAASAKPMHVGDKLRFTAKMSASQHALSPGVIDGYWLGLSRGVHARVTVSNSYKIKVISQQEGSFIEQIKESLKEKISANLTPREAGLLLALIMGDVKLFDNEQQEIYRNIGAGHLLAVSGLQVSMLSMIFFRIFLLAFLLIPWISRRSLACYPALVLTLMLVWTFVAMCGAPPSALRAALMSTLALFAYVFARPVTGADVFGAAGLIAVLTNPSCVVDASFWLSYAAVFGLILAARSAEISPSDLLLLNPETRSSSWRKKLRAVLLSSLSAGFITLPFGAYYFAQMSPSGLLVNLFLVPIACFLQTPAILLAVLAALFKSPMLFEFAAFFANVLEAMCMTLDSLVGHSFPVFPLTVFGLTVSVVAVLLLITSARPHRRFLKLSVASLCLLAAIVPQLRPKSEQLIVTFLPVGQGDAAVVEIPPGKVMVIDGGGSHDNTYNPGERVIMPFLQRRRIEVIDAVVLSHPDADHLMGLLPLLENFKVRELWHNGFDESHPLMARLIDVAKKQGVRLRARNEMPQQFAFGEATLDFIAPPKDLDDPELASTNNRSLVMRVGFADKSVLFPGDIEKAMEDALTKGKHDLRASIVKAPHHGSKGSSTDAFVKATGARHVVFCTGVNNRFGFPHSQAIKRWQDSGAFLWDTAKNGETSFKLSRETTEIAPFRTTTKGES